MKDLVLVTGANGHVGYNVVLELLKNNYEVRVSVRNKNDPKKVSKFKNLNIEIVEADLLNFESLKKATENVTGIFQVAAGYKLDSKNPKTEIWDAAVEGTRNIFLAAKQNNVKKIIYTSSVAAVGVSRNGEFKDESFWNDDAREYYAKAKTASEKLAWQLSKEYDIQMIALLPGMIIGPGFSAHTPSTFIFEKILYNKLPMRLDGDFSFIDVRDLAQLQVKAYELENLRGRYIVCTDPLSFNEVYKIAQESEPTIKIPKLSVPKFMIPILPLFDYLEHKLTNSIRTLTKGSVEEYLSGGKQNVSNKKMKNDFLFSPRPVKESVADTLAWIKENKLN